MTVCATKKTSTRSSSSARKKTVAKPSARRKTKKSTKTTAKRKSARSRKTDLESKPAVATRSVDEHRDRLRAIGDLLRVATVDLVADAESDDRVGRGAYLQVMGRAFEVLDNLAESFDLDDLVKISKIIVEQRRAELNSRKLDSASEDSLDEPADVSGVGDRGMANRQLPEAFGDIVRQIYGATLADDVCESSASVESHGSMNGSEAGL